MGIFGALTTAVSGLRAQSFALENISGNIANSRTTGFKRVDTSFVDLVPSTPAGRELAGSVAGFSQATNGIQGDLTTTGVGTNIAINGDGFFVVQERTGFAGGAPTFGGIDLYTRRGDFQLDRSGYLVNGAGYYLRGIALDPTTGNLVGSQPNLVRISGDNLPARATANVEYRANLPSNPDVAGADPTIPGSELYGLSTAGPYLAGSATAPAVGGGPLTVSAADSSVFESKTIGGGAVTVYNPQGQPINVQLRWAKTDSSALGAASDTWNLFFLSDSNATGAATAWTNSGTNYVFNNVGNLISPVPGTPIPLGATTIDNIPVPPINLDTGTLGLTQFAAADLNANRTEARTNRISQDGYASGELNSVTVGDGGRIVGNYTTGQAVGLAVISIAQFAAENSLKRRDGGVFEQTLESGQPVIEGGGRTVVGGATENSNTDIADEFSKMIVTQQAYSANTKIISTASDMLREIIGVIR